MSKINTLRIVNLNYNNNSIKISDEAFQFNGESTLMSLRNGGGKTVLVQMMTAPFVHKRYRDTKDRKFESYFTTNRPTLIMVEWLLDGEAGYVLTGMMVRKNQEVSDGEAHDELEMINFIYEYKERCENDIYHIPIINETASGMTLKNWGACKKLFENLKKEDSMHFNYYDMDTAAQSRMYFEKLKQYQINYKEWETIIKKINLKESGLSELFVDCRDEKGLVEKWFLEAVESKLNKEGSRINEFETIIKKYARQYKDNQTKIHRMKNLKSFLEQTSGIKIYADEYLDYTKQRLAKENDIAYFILILNELREEADVRKSFLDNEIRKRQRDIADIKYEDISYHIHQLDEQKVKLAHEYEQVTLERGQVVKQKEELENKRAVLLCAKENEAKNAAFAECKKLESRIETSKKSEKEKEPRRNELGRILFNHYSKAVSVCESEIRNIRENIKIQEEQEQKYNTSRSECFKQKDLNSLQIGKCQAKIINYDSVEEQFNRKYNERFMRNILGKYEVGVLELKGEEYEKQISEIKNKTASLKLEKSKNDEDYIKHGRSQEDIRNILIDKKGSLNIEKERLADYETQLMVRQYIIKYFLVEENNIYNKTVILNSAERKLQEISAAKRMLERENEQLAAEVKLLESRRILEVSREFEEYLSSLEIDFIYGMEWLSNNGRSFDENKKIAANNPFIPYAIIISSADFEKISEDKSKVFTAMPVPIVKREELEEGFINNETGVVELDKVNFYLAFQSELLDAEKRYDIIEQKKKKAEKVQDNIERRDAEYREYFSKQECIKNQTIQSDSIEVCKENVEKLESEITELKNRLEHLENLRREIVQTNEHINQKIAELNEKKGLADIRMQDFNLLKENYCDYCDAKEEKIKLDKKNDDINNKLNILSEKLEELIENIKSDEKNEMRKKQEKISLQERYEFFEEFKEGVEHEDGDKLLEEEERIAKEAEYNALLKDYSNTMQLLNEQYTSARERFTYSRKELEELLAKYGLDISKVEKIKYDKEEKGELDERISSNKMKIQLYNEKLAGIDKKITKKQSDIEHAYSDMYRICDRKEPVSKEKINDTNFKDRIILLQNEIKERQSDLDGVEKLFAGYEANLSALAEYSEFKAGESESAVKKSDISGKSVKDIDKFRGMMIRDYRGLLENERKQSAIIARMLNDMARKNDFRDDFFQKPIEVLMSITDNAVNFLKQLDILVSSYESMIEKLEVDVAIVEKERTRIVELIEEYVRDVHEELGKIDGNSTIKVHGKDKKMLKITIPEWDSNEEIYHLKLQDILDDVTAKTVKTLEENNNPEDVISLYINTKYLYNTVVGTGNVCIRLYKIEEQKGREISWSDVAKNSGGEGFLSAFIVLSSLLYYMRKDVSDVFANYNEGKVLVMDNPFAQTNASHLLKPLMDMAKKTNTQLICLSGLGGDSIYDRFDNIYVLNLVAASLRNGMQYLKGEHTRGDEQETMIATQIHVTQQELMF
ncbi:hypothetical protein KQI69_03180 [Eubacterium sp. MSJ-13]|uniref:hypothetical protein n=1 Tax=Eubacterium sp. MSJ-13 TaxID=2841513 RepID=UPI001C103568|nr:hypothetical protein [Eubacterium sp. MSJ-13]MBU5478200.1 hypothetical protein [Eubacterium sp. MSJ-13]